MGRTLLLLALAAVLVLALGSCGGGGGGQTTSATSAKTTGGGTTSAKTTTTAGGGTVPAEMASSTVQLTPSQDSGVSGTATLTNSNGGVDVVLNVQGLQDQPGTEHLAHIHQGGTCADDRTGNGAPVQYPLNSVITEQGGTGTSTTEVSGVTVAQLFSGEAKYVNVHAEQTGNETPPGISCADLSSRDGSTVGAAKQD
jgi:hypothetical protein